MPGTPPDSTARRLAQEFLGSREHAQSAFWPGQPWQYLVLSRYSPRSQYDRMIQLLRGEEGLPDRLVCVAGSGQGFHGFKGRPWSADAGNLHVTVHLAPNQTVERFHTAFTVLAALSVVDAIDAVPGLDRQARIKWVNDVLLGGAKVAGTLSYTQTQGTHVSSALLGIGLNVETAPVVERTPCVPAVGAVADFAPGAEGATQRDLLANLLSALHGNYRTLLDDGVRPLLDRYRIRSGIVGSHVAVYGEDPGSDPSVISEGRVAALGDGLELYLEGREEPITRGRLVFVESAWRDRVDAVPVTVSERS
jgi:BirA family biotin operon repressor/biotin-[acetyl-CoA-carboxylase] ligase